MAAGGRPKNRFDAGWIRPDVIRRCGVWNRCAGWIRQPGVGWSRSGAAWSRQGVAGGYRHRPVEWNWFGVAEYFRFDGPRNRLSERWNRFWAAAGSWFDLQRLWAGEELGDHSGLLDQTSSSLLAGAEGLLEKSCLTEVVGPGSVHRTPHCSRQNPAAVVGRRCREPTRPARVDHPVAG